MKAGDIIKLGVILMLYTALACVGLSFVYAGTKAIIEDRAKTDLETSLKELFPSASSFEDITGTIPSPEDGIAFESEYAITKDGRLIGAAFQVSTGSYGGSIKVLVGINAGGTISRVKILSHSDTPGLGANAADNNYFVDEASGTTFFGQFSGKAVTDPFEPKNDVIAITAATITSRAVSRAVRGAGQAGAAWLASGVNR